jgi:serine/threonine protein kinase
VAEGTGLTSLKRGDVINSRYEIVKPLGDGMLGATYLAKHMASSKHVAIKFLHARLVRNPKDRERLEAAFRTAKGLRHEGIIRYGELGNYESTVFFTQEFYEGQSLRSLIDEYMQQGKAFSLQEACQITIKVLEAVQHLHAADQVHRNLKPENILVHTQPAGPAGQVVRTIKITDVGLADIVNPSLFAEGYIQRRSTGYLAPELSSFDDEGTSVSDLYSVGVILYELLVGQPPRGTYLAPTQLRADLPDHIDDIVEVAMAADPLDRYPGPQDMLNDIQRSFQGLIVSAKPRTSLKNIMMGIGLTLVVLALAGMYASTFTEEDHKRSAVELATEEDDRIRREIRAQTHMPTEAEMMAMVQNHSDMLYIPPGPFIQGRLRQESMKADVTCKVKGETDGEYLLDDDGSPVLRAKEDSKGKVKKKELASKSEPLHRKVNVPGFFIDRYEFPNRVKNEDGSPVMPLTNVTWQAATESCEKLGKRLCTEEEWEKACKGPENTVYSYDDRYEQTMCGGAAAECSDDPGDIHHVGQDQTKTESCMSGYGVADMSGNVREWTASQPGTKADRRTVKGGASTNNQRGTRCAYSGDDRAQNYGDPYTGFRCCLSLPSGENGVDTP